jgi:transcriptional regulator with PAS, ATPase and Fis domain
MITQVLCAWLGQHDIDAAADSSSSDIGPIGSALSSEKYQRIELLSNYPREDSDEYLVWLGAMYPKIGCARHQIRLSSPTAYEEIYTAADVILQGIHDENVGLTFHLSPGTPAMASIWILLASGKYRAKLIETHKDTGLKEVNLPFDILAQYRPEKSLGSHISAMEDDLLPESPAFDLIIHESEGMRRAVAKAKRAAVFDVPVLLLGESGTGKELFAKAIHVASPRSNGPFIAVNCGAIPESLAESALFGHAKGAFTGANEARSGFIEQAHKGTLFLDEIGELSPDIQVKLLRVLNDKKVQRIGETKDRNVDFRLISATNRYLAREAAEDRFRQDLFHRIAVGVIKLPPLRERGGDLPLITGHVVKSLNGEFANTPGWEEKKLNVGALKAITEHSWPGNIRELINTLTRAFVFNGGREVDERALKDSLLMMGRSSEEVLHRPLGNGFSIEDALSETARHYLERAMKQAGGNKTQASKLLDLGSYQTLTNWLEKYVVGEE